MNHGAPLGPEEKRVLSQMEMGLLAGGPPSTALTRYDIAFIVGMILVIIPPVLIVISSALICFILWCGWSVVSPGKRTTPPALPGGNASGAR